MLLRRAVACLVVMAFVIVASLSAADGKGKDKDKDKDRDKDKPAATGKDHGKADAGKGTARLDVIEHDKVDIAVAVALCDRPHYHKGDLMRLLGIVKPEDAFRGFSDDIVVIVGSALVISGAVQRSGVLERALRKVSRHVTRVRSQLLVLTGTVGVASALVKNIGALAMLILFRK